MTIADAPTSVFLAPVAVGGQMIAAGLFPSNQRVTDMIFAVIVLALVEWTLHRRMKSHFNMMDQILNRAVLTAESLDAQHAADLSYIQRIDGRTDRINSRLSVVESKLGIQPPLPHDF